MAKIVWTEIAFILLFGNLSDNKSFSHQDKQGNNGEVRLKKAGMSLSYRGELLAEATDAPQAFSALKGSVKHKEIMLKDDYTIV